MMDNIFRNEIRIRCPKCEKLYTVDRRFIGMELPQFECVSCRSRFQLAFHPSQEQIEVPTTFLQSAALSYLEKDPKREPPTIAQMSFSCSKCGAKNLKGSPECGSCGLVFEKWRRKQLGISESIGAGSELKASWDKVLTEYENMALHEAFVRLALDQNNLPFASQQYRKILEVNATESIAISMRERILEIATASYVPPRRITIPRRRVSVPLVVLGIGGLFIASGFLIPALRGIIPLGGFLCALGCGFFYLSRS